jgi:hypothetical protein
MSDNKLTIEEANKLDDNLEEFMRIRDEYDLCRKLLKSMHGTTTAEDEIRKYLFTDYWFKELPESTKKRIVDAVLDILIDVASKDGKILMTKYFDKV